MGNLNIPAAESPRLPGIRRIFVVGLSALAMAALAVGLSLFELQHNREVQQQYENTMALTRLAFDAESLASRTRALQQITPTQAAQAETGDAALREALRSLDADATEWDQRIAVDMRRDLSDESRDELARLQTAMHALRAASTPGAGANAASDRAYLGAVEAAQAALLGSMRAGVDRNRIAGHSLSELATAATVIAAAWTM